MTAAAIAICNAGLVTSVGLSAPASCAAIRAKVSNASQTRFADSSGNWIMAHQVPLQESWRGRAKLARMAAMAIEECLRDVPPEEWGGIPMLLCVAEQGRPGRQAGVDDLLLQEIRAQLTAPAAERHTIIANGRIGVAIGLAQARKHMQEEPACRMLLVAVDSLLGWPTLEDYQRKNRLLTASNSNGFMPGEGAGALLLARPSGKTGELLCTGIGFGQEEASIDSTEPLRGDGLSQAVKTALADAGLAMQHMHFRITDNAGEQYYFKEAALALQRTLRVRKADFDHWHPAECTGEIGAAAGISIIANAMAACAKRYAKGANILVHLGNDSGERASLTLQYREAA
ncbi:3-oxoacyl-ACP synthase [Pseudoduganella violaceinigra]|uniref:3-oxoacyl-ACP synthase n=1 Tax=Pseudoduganella violaceinigra TaxID=246602 RepID=UPI0004870F42|nr:3-oxoacyl-ACP synthase [Pseudoduganella violaceinigra]